jgi:hypothetical protein
MGAPCNLHAQCQSPLFCDIDDFDRTCTALCLDDDRCDAISPGSVCILGAGASADGGPLGHCVQPCKADSDCPRGAACAVAGWCARDASFTDIVGRRDVTVPPDGDDTAQDASLTDGG